MNLGIIGDGFVGEATRRGFEECSKVDKINVYDPKYGHTFTDLSNVVHNSQFLFVCVPTPTNFEKRTQDLKILNNVLHDMNTMGGMRDKIVVIKSTVHPGTTVALTVKYPNLRLVHNLEFLTEKNHIDDFIMQDRIVLGGEKNDIEWLKLLYLTGWPNARYYLMGKTESELVKYFSNCALAVKVALFNEFFSICDKMSDDIDFPVVHEAVVADDRIGSSHTSVPGHDGDFGFGGKCVLPGNKVFTINGVKNIENIKVGDLVLTHTGTYKKVEEVFIRDVDEDVMEVKVQGHGQIELTKEHPVLAIKANRQIDHTGKLRNTKIDIVPENLDWIEIDELEKGDFVVLPKISQIQSPEPMMMSEQLMFLLGVYVADGHVETRKDRENCNRVVLAFNTNEAAYICLVKNTLNAQGISNIEERVDGNSTNLRFTDQRLATFFKTHGGEAHNKHISTDALNSKYVSTLLRGYFCGDGSISGDIYTCATISQKLFYDLQQCLLALGIGFRTHMQEARTDSKGVYHKKSYWIKISRQEDIERFSNLVMTQTHKCIKGREVAFSRKTSWFDDDYMFIPIKSIETKKYIGIVYNIEVTEDHSYVSPSMTIHNCFPKDLNALIGLAKHFGAECGVLDAAWMTNIVMRKNKDWEEIEGATSYE